MGAIHQTLLAFKTAGGGGDFDFANLLWRVRAYDIIGLNDGDDINGTWDDISGNNRDWTSTGHPSFPKYQTNEINGHPAVEFRGQSNNDYFTGPDISGLGLTEIDFYAVVKAAADPASGGVPYGLWQFNNANYANAHTRYPDTGGTIRMTACLPSGQASLDINPTPSLAAWHLLRVVAKTGTNNYEIFNDGTSITQGTRTSLVFPSITELGRASDNGGTAYFHGHITEFFAFSTKTVGAQITSIHDYINNFYGLSLP